MPALFRIVQVRRYSRYACELYFGNFRALPALPHLASLDPSLSCPSRQEEACNLLPIPGRRVGCRLTGRPSSKI